MANNAAAGFQRAYQISPIILVGGIAQDIPSGQMPILSITQAQDFDTGILSSSDSDTDMDQFFAQFIPMGGTLIENEVGHYPFANQYVAANAIISQPLTISMRMICPVRPGNTYANKNAVLTNLQSRLAQHNSSGGTYTIFTPSFSYNNCLMLAFRDITPEGDKQVQWQWQMDFEQPLLTVAQAVAAQNALMSKASAGTQVDGDPPTWSGLSTTTGQPIAGSTPSLIPAAQNAGGAGTPPPQGPTQ